MKRKARRTADAARRHHSEPPSAHPGDAPLLAFLSLTTHCNLHCKGCYAVPERGPAQSMDYDLAEAILSRLEELGFSAVWFGGGEPLLHPHLFPLAEYARSLALSPRMSTNGTLLDGHAARQCTVFDQLHISLHTIDDLPALEAARHSLALAGITPVLDVLLTNKTFSQLADVCAWARLMKIPRLHLMKFAATAENARHRNMQMFPAQEEALVPWALKWSRKHRLQITLDCAFGPLARANGLSARDAERLGLDGCPGGFRSLSIDVLGRYKPCLFWPETFGNALDLSLDDWLHGAALAEFRQQAGSARCEGCPHLSACNQGCRLHGEQLCELGD